MVVAQTYENNIITVIIIDVGLSVNLLLKGPPPLPILSHRIGLHLLLPRCLFVSRVEIKKTFHVVVIRAALQN